MDVYRTHQKHKTMRINIHKLQQSTQSLWKNDAVVEIGRREGERERWVANSELRI
jgi:predicted DCC family thiol-disulfide oxidoreductase YuxK